MNFLEAIKAMKEGKKVRRNVWSKGVYYYFGDGIMVHNNMDIDDKSLIRLPTPEVEATDWQIVEEKPEDWTDVKTIDQWRGRVQDRFNKNTDATFVKINEDLKKAFWSNFDEITRQRLSCILTKTKVCEIEGIKVTVEEKKTLSIAGVHNGKGFYFEEDVKEFIQDVKEDIKRRRTHYQEIEDCNKEMIEIINKRVGERLM